MFGLTSFVRVEGVVVSRGSGGIGRGMRRCGPRKAGVFGVSGAVGG